MGNDKTKQKRSKKIKEFDELTITDDFMFGAVMSDPKRCKPLLEYILGIKIIKIEYAEKQKVIDLEYRAKGVRLDLHIIDDKGVVYNVEIQTGANDNLPKRIRYYHDVLDLNLLKKSADYEALPKCYVIFICTFDFFEKSRYMYTFKRQCQEDASVYLNDEAITIVLNTQGTVGDIDDELRNALRYMAGQTPTGKYATDLDKAVKEVKESDEWRAGYMNYTVKLRDHERAAQRLGALESKVASVRNHKGKLPDDTIISILDLDKNQFIEISDMIDNYPDWTDEDIAADIIGE